MLRSRAWIGWCAAALLLGVAGCSALIDLVDVPPASAGGSTCKFDGDAAVMTLDHCVFAP